MERRTKMAKKVITVSLYNRLDYTRQVFEHLNRCIGIRDYEIIAHIDWSPIQDQFMEYFATSLPANINLLPYFSYKNLGCNKSIYQCLSLGFDDTDYLIHIEDDILLAKDALQYFEWASKKFKDDKTIFTVDGYNNGYSYSPGDLSIVYKATSFKPWGWATWKDRFEGIKDSWQFGYEGRYEQGECIFKGGGWDVCMKQLLRGDRCRVYPKIARTKNIGALGGVHTPSAEWHKRKHDISCWANDFNEGLGYYNLVH